MLSYQQTIKAYPSAGGAYIVTRDNFGLLPAQVAGVSLLLDYIMTVAVSISADVAALYSYFPALFAIRVPLAVLLIGVMTLGNLRGMRASGRLFSAPTYAFLVTVGSVLVLGVARALAGGLHPIPPPPGIKAAAAGGVAFLLVLHAYASGTTALTGVEAISNGVTVFRPPESKNARRVLLIMGAILATMFGGITLLAWKLRPVPTDKKTLISEVGRALFGKSATGRAGLFALQVTTRAILVLAANTSFSDFARLANFHAGDGYLPRPLRHRGPRLGFTVGIAALAIMSTVVVVLLGADVHRLIPLYAVGVFASFTFSQAGMTRRHLRLREEGWRTGMAINGLGAAGSLLALAAILVAKFSQGAWAITILVPAGVILFLRIHHHYTVVGEWMATPEAAAAWTRTAVRAVVIADSDDLAAAGTAWSGPFTSSPEVKTRREAMSWARSWVPDPHDGAAVLFVIPHRLRGRGGAQRRWDRLARRLARLPGATVAVLNVADEVPDPVAGHERRAVVATPLVSTADSSDRRRRRLPRSGCGGAASAAVRCDSS